MFVKDGGDVTGSCPNVGGAMHVQSQSAQPFIVFIQLVHFFATWKCLSIDHR